ncbi:MAG: hypothetical protein HQK55_00615 [Deltaproteobacteria bacterium]|nr:hypothetical protein [Deltaproteobacteria bacterium]
MWEKICDLNILYGKTLKRPETPARHHYNKITLSSNLQTSFSVFNAPRNLNFRGDCQTRNFGPDRGGQNSDATGILTYFEDFKIEPDKELGQKGSFAFTSLFFKNRIGTYFALPLKYQEVL